MEVSMKKILFMGFCVLLWSHQAVAVQVCQSLTIKASAPASRFIVNGNGTVTDNKTHLTWKRCSEGQTWTGTTCTGAATALNVQSALNAAVTFNANGGLGGFTDWRVPNMKELQSIIEQQCITPSINTSIFPATVSNFYWSSSPDSASGGGYFLAVDFNNGVSGGQLGTTSVFGTQSYHVRLVRGGTKPLCPPGLTWNGNGCQ